MALEDAGFSADTAADGAAGWSAFEAAPPDLVILDRMMPELDGLEVLRRIRRRHDTPVLVLTSRDEELDEALGLELGADDDVAEPFSTRALVARLRAVSRRVGADGPAPEPSAARRVGALSMDRGRREVALADRPIAATATEFELLWSLLGGPGRVFSRNELIDAVYGEDVVVSHRSIDTVLERLRKKPGDAGPAFEGLEAVRSVGYRFRG